MFLIFPSNFSFTFSISSDILSASLVTWPMCSSVSFVLHMGHISIFIISCFIFCCLIISNSFPWIFFPISIVFFCSFSNSSVLFLCFSFNSQIFSFTSFKSSVSSDNLEDEASIWLMKNSDWLFILCSISFLLKRLFFDS